MANEPVHVLALPLQAVLRTTLYGESLREYLCGRAEREAVELGALEAGAKNEVTIGTDGTADALRVEVYRAGEAPEV